MIFTFWEGEMPAYIRLCMETWKLPYIVLNYENVGQYTNLDIKRTKRFTLPQIADCVRVHVLRDNGGCWLDADTIMITGNLPEETILGDPEARINTIGLLNTEPHSEMFEEWAGYQDRILQGYNTPDYWAIMGNVFTDPYLKEHSEIEIGPIDNCWPETYMVDAPSRYHQYRKLYFECDYQLSDMRKTDMLMLHNSWTPEWYKQLTEEQVLDKDCTLSNILRELL